MPRTTVHVSGTTSGATTDESGRYGLSLSPGVYVLNFSFINYEDEIIDLAAYADGEINMEMETTPTLLQEVIIQNQFNQDITTSRIGETDLSMVDVKTCTYFTRRS